MPETHHDDAPDHDLDGAARELLAQGRELRGARHDACSVAERRERVNHAVPGDPSWACVAGSAGAAQRQRRAPCGPRQDADAQYPSQPHVPILQHGA